ncbi:MAG: hypothetical protein ABH896_00635 [Candidatus Jacksonbacteria bacterium]
MFNELLATSLKNLFSLTLVELLALIGLILFFASLTIKLTKAKRNALIFIIWGVAVLLSRLFFQWYSAEPNLIEFLKANGLLLTLIAFIITGLFFGAMAFGLWSIFFRATVGRANAGTLYVYSSTYSPRKAKKNGKKDGKLNASPKHYEESLLHFAEQNANLIAKQWNDTDKKLKAEYCNALSKRDVSQNKLTLSKEELNKPKTDFEQEQEKYKTTYTTHHLGTGAYWFVIILIGLAELPFNLVAFRAILGEIEAVNIFFSLLVSGIFAASIHSLGQFFGENPFEKGFKKVITEDFIPLSGALFLVFVIVGLAKYRENYIASFQKQLAGFGFVAEISPAMASVILGVIVAFFAVFGIEIGRRRYKPQVAERRIALSTAYKCFKLAQIGITKAEKTHQKMLKKFYKTEANRKNEFNFMRQAVEIVNKRIQELAKIYRMYYERAAKKKRPTESVHFDSLPISEMPEGLRELDERCAV